MEDICQRFGDGPHPGKDGRYCIRENYILRKAKFKVVKRWAILCNDVLVICGVKNMKDSIENMKLEQKQVLDLSTLEINERPNTKGITYAFGLTAPDRQYVFGCDTSVEREAWIASIRRAVAQQMRHRQSDLEGNEQLYRGTLHHCAFTDNIEEAEQILTNPENREQLSRRNEQGYTPIHIAIVRGSHKCLQLFHEKGAKLENASESRSVLHLAAEGAYPKIFEYLLKHQINMEAKRDDNMTALGLLCLNKLQHLSRRRHDVSESIAIMIKWGADVDIVVNNHPLLHEVAGKDLLVACQALLEGGVHVNAVDNAGNTAIHEAAKYNALRTLRCLLQHGIQPNGRNLNLDTALHFAQSKKAVALLVVHGARLNLTNQAGVAAWKHEFITDNDLNKLKDIEKNVETVTNVKGDGRPPVDESHPRWMPDADSNSCVTCFSQFTLTNRRHHCRRCGLLLCSSCSKKRFEAKLNNETKQFRCCVGCFNLLRAKLQGQLLSPDSVIGAHNNDDEDNEDSLDDVDSDNDDEDGLAKAIAYANKYSTVKSNRVKSSDNKKTKNNQRQADPRAAINQTLDALERRGEVLNEVEQKSEMLNNEASDFHKSAKQLRQKYE